MSSLIFNSLYVFFLVLEIILFIYIISTWFPLSPKVREFFTTLLGPILEPIRYLLEHSIFKTRTIDLSPIIAFVILSYLQQLFLHLK